MMICYVAVPARIVGVRPTHSRRDKLAAGIVGGVIGALVCAPGYLLGRLGIVLLGSHRLFALGVILLAIGFALQAGTTSAVKTVKMSAKLIAGQPVTSSRPAGREEQQPARAPGGRRQRDRNRLIPACASPAASTWRAASVSAAIACSSSTSGGRSNSR